MEIKGEAAEIMVASNPFDFSLSLEALGLSGPASRPKTRSEKRADAVQTLIRERRAGRTLRLSAIVAGLHVSTVCRWQARDPELRQALAEAAREARASLPKDPRPHVRWRKDCPLCRAKMVVRTAKGRRFWRCGRWPECPW